ncbi:uncharacterized protein LOC122508675 [Leptopilina heterotoma]|uniref:uncharacterized protein LOC122508675 n=1 Tax=Leptopilina heterotoma TaxID=63436 RepID=UPI001CA9D33E|nr:uncharacterized protein LOC122508675 [Leptopilina heterotoma]
MNSSKMERFLPNECYICKSRDNLKRCECNMISYCSEDHRLEHLPVHETFCKVIKELLKQKRVSHIHEELKILGGFDWKAKKEKISLEVTKKLGRPMSLLENAMWKHPRLCFFCRQTRQEDLKNCPDCPVASFCKKHPQDELHSTNCKVMNRYLNILNTAEELNIDLKFLSPTFPCIAEEKVNQVIDELTRTFKVIGIRSKCFKSRFSKIDLINFMDVASKMNSALQKVHDTIPEVLTIHIDALFSKHAITKKNYWEFLLHLNPQIKKLKIVITQTENRYNSKTSLCENCISEEKELIVEYSSEFYDDYMLDENYQKPDILFYLKINDQCNFEKRNQWSELYCPVILRFDSKLKFCKTHHFLASSTAKFRFIYEGQFTTPFSTLSSIDNEDYFIILQSKENKVLQKSIYSARGEICEGQIGTMTDINENSKLETNENLSDSNSYIDLSKITIELENTIINEIEEEKNSNNEKTKNRESTKEEKSKDDNMKKNIEERKEGEEETFNFSKSYVIGHVSYLKDENEGLRQQLNLAFNEITKLQTKLNKKEKVIKKLLGVIVDFEDTDSQSDEEKEI